MRTDRIGINISKLRIERGITQEQLGRDIGLTASAISNIECGRSVPSVDTLCRFSELFGVKVDTILSDESDSDLNKLEMEEKLVTVDRYLSEIKATRRFMASGFYCRWSPIRFSVCLTCGLLEI